MAFAVYDGNGDGETLTEDGLINVIVKLVGNNLTPEQLQLVVDKTFEMYARDYASDLDRSASTVDGFASDLDGSAADAPRVITFDQFRQVRFVACRWRNCRFDRFKKERQI